MSKRPSDESAAFGGIEMLLLDHLQQLVHELETRSYAPERFRKAASDPKLAAAADSMYRSRRFRGHFFDPVLFGEPAWDMLLDLFIGAIRGAQVATTSLCIASGAPQATALRCIAHLNRHGLIRRYRAPGDGRLKLVALTPRGLRLMRAYLSEAIVRFRIPGSA